MTNFRSKPIYHRRCHIYTIIRKKEKVEAGTKLILVDHNESKQCVDGAKEADVLELIDHHRIGDFETTNPIFILVRPVGCVNTVIWGLYKAADVKPSQAVAGMMLSAIISDTVLFRSPTTTEEDKAAVRELAEIAGKDIVKVIAVPNKLVNIVVK